MKLFSFFQKFLKKDQPLKEDLKADQTEPLHTAKDEVPIEIDEALLEKLQYKWESAQEIIDQLVADVHYQNNDHLKFLQYLVNLIDQERIELPLLPDIVTRMIQLSLDPHATFSDYVDLVKSDQVIALKVIEIANTPYFRGREKIQDLHTAITRIGIKGLKELVIMISVRASIFNHKFYKKEVLSIWEHTLLTALLAANVASYCGVERSKAYTLGLIHDIGLIVVYNAIKGFRKLHTTETWPDPFFIQRVAMSFHQKLSAFTLAKWRIDDELINPIRTHHTLPTDQATPLQKLLYFSFQTATLIQHYNYPTELDTLPDLMILQAKQIELSAVKIKEVIIETTKQFQELNGIV